MNRECIDFVNAHRDDDTARLLLGAARYPDVDMALAVNQIKSQRTAAEKWPSLLRCEQFIYPPRLNREQSSSEATAALKVRVANRLCASEAPLAVADLTGGMGIDSIAFARQGTRVDYVERDAELCRLMEHNSGALGLNNLTVNHADSITWLSSIGGRTFDAILIDPARRAASGRKVAAFEDCEPNILQHLDLLRSHCKWLIVKASPMIDLTLAERQLGAVAGVHVVSVRGECKEVLFVCGTHQGESAVHCTCIGKDGEPRELSFARSAEAIAQPSYCQTVGRYLYEPDAAILKAGAFNLVCQWFGIEKLATNTHLYTSDRLAEHFSGRIYRVEQEVKLNRRSVLAAIGSGRAHVATRNYPVAAAELQRQLSLREGGDTTLVATTVGSHRVGLICRQL